MQTLTRKQRRILQLLASGWAEVKEMIPKSGFSELKPKYAVTYKEGEKQGQTEILRSSDVNILINKGYLNLKDKTEAKNGKIDS